MAVWSQADAAFAQPSASGGDVLPVLARISAIVNPSFGVIAHGIYSW